MLLLGLSALATPSLAAFLPLRSAPPTALHKHKSVYKDYPHHPLPYQALHPVPLARRLHRHWLTPSICHRRQRRLGDRVVLHLLDGFLLRNAQTRTRGHVQRHCAWYRSQVINVPLRAERGRTTPSTSPMAWIDRRSLSKYVFALPRHSRTDQRSFDVLKDPMAWAQVNTTSIPASTVYIVRFI